MDTLLNGWDVFADHWAELVLLVVTVWGLGSWASFRFFSANEFPFIQKILVVMNVGVLVTTWLCFIVVLLGQLSSTILMAGSFAIPVLGVICLLSSVLGRRLNFHFIENKRALLVLIAVLFIFLLPRLAFAKSLLLPPYDDSPEHYAMILDLLGRQAFPSASFYSLGNLTEHYYHFGFHTMAAWLTIVSNASPAEIMILLGQLLLVFSSLSIFLLALVLTENIPASLLAGILAGFAWRMPAYAANWGKYPAMAGLVLLPGWFALFILYCRLSKSKLLLWFLSVLMIVGLGLIHTRIFVCILLLGMSVFVIFKVPQPLISSKIGSLLIFAMALTSSVLFFKEISIFYSTAYFFPIGMVLVLLPFAILAHPRLVGTLSLAICGVWLASIVPVFFEGYGANWLDGPFIELLLFIPFALYGGLGFSGFLRMFPNLVNQTRGLLLLPPLFIILAGFYTSSTFSPDACCNYISKADVSAMEWIEKNTTPNAVIWIAGVKSKNYMLGTDGGIWVSALTGRNMNKLRFDFEWESQAAPPKLCQSGDSDVYIYKGVQAYSFRSLEMENVVWLQPAFEEADVILYRVLCPGN